MNLIACPHKVHKPRMNAASPPPLTHFHVLHKENSACQNVKYRTIWQRPFHKHTFLFYLNIFRYFPMVMAGDYDYPLPLKKVQEWRKKIKYYNYLTQLSKIEAPPNIILLKQIKINQNFPMVIIVPFVTTVYEIW